MASKNIEKGVLRSNMPLVRVVYKTLGGNNNYSFRSFSAAQNSQTRVVEGEGGRRRTKRRARKEKEGAESGGCVACPQACFRALSMHSVGRVNQPRDHRENNAVEILLSGNGSSFHRSNLPPSPLSPFLFLFRLSPSTFLLLQLLSPERRKSFCGPNLIYITISCICVQIYSRWKSESLSPRLPSPLS